MSTCRAIGRSVNPVLSVESLLDTVLEFEAVNNGNTYVEHLGIQANGGTMVFDELHLAPSERLTLTHKNGIQQVMIEGSGKRSALGKRLENSWDELPIKGGANTIIAVADVACNWVFRARGRFT